MRVEARKIGRMTSTDTQDRDSIATVAGWTVTLEEGERHSDELLLRASRDGEDSRFATARRDSNGLALAEFTDPDGTYLPDDVRQPLYDAVYATLTD